MPVRFLSALLCWLLPYAALASSPSAASPFDHKALGGCFADIDAFIRSGMGQYYISDPNIMRTTKGSWTWIVDQTASKNYTWYLLETAGAKVCLRSFVPAAASIEFHAGSAETQLDAFIAPEADFPAKVIELLRLPGSQVFRPIGCFRILANDRGGIPTRKSIPCSQVFD